ASSKPSPALTVSISLGTESNKALARSLILLFSQLQRPKTRAFHRFHPINTATGRFVATILLIIERFARSRSSPVLL
ncbi:MAG TPA: hypothetical protein VEQ40_01720, partial [Pyrinomonadaceae bacterium]|nr:hypothetical protein [Pyrinomonadaceae bacterium]